MTDDDLEALRDATRGFLARRFPRDAVRAAVDGPRVHDAEGWRAAAGMGWIGAALPEDHGGLGADPVMLAVIAEELGRATFTGPFLGCALAATLLAETDSDEARALAARLADGAATAAWCVTEADGSWRSEAISMTTDGAALTGEKHFVLDADAADVLLVSARAEVGPATFAVRADTPGVTIEPTPGLDVTRSLSRVRFDGVPAGTRVDGAGAIERALDLGTLLTIADTVGCAGQLMEMTVDYTLHRIAFGKPIASYQAVKHKCADMLCWVEAARAATRYAATALRDAPEAGATALSVAKSHAGDTCSRLAGESLQVHGGVGFTWEHDLHLYLRRIKADEVMFGDIAEHRERLAAALG